MKRRNFWQAGLQVMLASSLAGTTFQAGCLGTIARNFNPCGTVLDCDPVEWDFMFHAFPDWDIDPTCTIPGLCGGQWPPQTGSGGAVNGGGGQTGTQTGGTTGGVNTGTGGFGTGTGGFGTGLTGGSTSTGLFGGSFGGFPGTSGTSGRLGF
jgi:hypothetical protein